MIHREWMKISDKHANMKRKIKTRKYTNIYKVLPYMNVIQSYISWTLTRSCTCRSIGRRDIGHSGKWWVPDEGGYAMTYESLNWWYNNHFSDSYTSKHMHLQRCGFLLFALLQTSRDSFATKFRRQHAMTRAGTGTYGACRWYQSHSLGRKIISSAWQHGG